MIELDITRSIIRVIIVANKGTCLLTLCALHAFSRARPRVEWQTELINGR